MRTRQLLVSDRWLGQAIWSALALRGIGRKLGGRDSARVNSHIQRLRKTLMNLFVQLFTRCGSTPARLSCR